MGFIFYFVAGFIDPGYVEIGDEKSIMVTFEVSRWKKNEWVSAKLNLRYIYSRHYCTYVLSLYKQLVVFQFMHATTDLFITRGLQFWLCQGLRFTNQFCII